MGCPAIIIGGGISGLSAAYYLGKAGVRATLIEKSPALGGVIQTQRIQDCVVESGPDSFLAAKPWAMDLIREVGLEDQVIGSNDRLRVTYVLRNGKLRPLPDGMIMMSPTKVLPVLTSTLLSWRSKARMAREFFRHAGGPGEDRSVEAFLLDHYDQEAIDYLAEPLLAGVSGGNPKQLSANSVLPRWVELEAKYGSLARGLRANRTRESGPLFRTLKGGMRQLVDRLAPSADVIRGEAEAIEAAPIGYRVRVNGAWVEAECVFIGAPAYAAGHLLGALNGELGTLLNGIPYASSVTLALGYSRDTVRLPKKGFGFLVPNRERRLMKACTWVNNKFAFRVPDDKVLLRCFFGSEAIEYTGAALIRTAQEELRTIMGVEAEPVFSSLTRWNAAMAQYTVGHAARVQRIEALIARHPGLQIGGNGYHGVGIPDCIRSGKEAAGNLLLALHHQYGERAGLGAHPAGFA